MNGFEIIALRYNGGGSKYKNLQPDILYKFVEKYKLFDGKENELRLGAKLERFHDIESISENEEVVFNLYNAENGSETKINISAIVGKNGSGKTSLFELLKLFIYLLSIQKRFLPWAAHEDMYREPLIETLKKYKIEVVYVSNNSFYLLKKTAKSFLFYKLESSGWVREKFDRKKFFFTISVNYSLYGLNESTDFWLSSLFHKNDGYKAPITVTPYRRNGVIDVKNENHLTQTRILTSFIYNRSGNQPLVDEKFVSQIEFSFESNAKRRISKLSYQEVFRSFLRDRGTNIFDEVSYFLDQKFEGLLSRKFADKLTQKYLSESQISEGEDYKVFLFEYIVFKFIKIPIVYSDYFDDEIMIQADGSIFCRNLRSSLRRIFNSRSHLTLKLFQAINTMRFDYFSDLTWKRRPGSTYSATIEIEKYTKIISRAIEHEEHQFIRNKELELLEYVPGAFFKPQFSIKEGDDSYSFYDLSSGEQQTIHSVQVLLYHLTNLENSVHQSYGSANILLDEIELYNHPEYQRLFLDRLVSALLNLKLTKIKNINIIFSTHSPFILSDIPHYSILQMRNGVPSPITFEKTFGANLYDLLTNNFFLEDGTVGKFAENYITTIIDELNCKVVKRGASELRKRIMLISEPVIREKLLDMIEEKADSVKEKIKYYQEQIKYLRTRNEDDTTEGK